MATKLKGLVVDRVDLVDIGANLDRRTGDGAHIMLFKRAAEIAKKIVERDGEFCVMSADGSQSMGCHATMADAKSHLAAIESKKAFAWNIAALAVAKRASADLVAKAEHMARTFDEILAGQRARRALDQLWDLYYSFMESAQSIFASEEADKIGLLKDSAIDFMNAFLAALPEAVEDGHAVEMAVAKIGRKISSKRMNQLREMHEKLGALLKEVSEGDDTMKIAEFAKGLGVTVPENATDEQVQKAIADHMAAQVAAAVAKAKPAAIDEQVQKALDAQKTAFEAELAKRDEQLAAAQLLAKGEKDLRILKQFEDQARTDFSGLGLSLEKKADAKTDAEIFKALSEKAPEEWTRVAAILKGGAEAVRTSKLFEEEGASGPGTAGSAEGQILSIAKGLVEKGVSKTLEQAIAAVATDAQHAELYRRYVDEQREKAKH